MAQIGYVLLAVAAGTRFGAGMALFFFVAYLFSNMGAFLSVAALEAAGEEPTLHGVRNLIRRSPRCWPAPFLVFLLSLGGIPFALGFWGKLYVFLAAGRAGLWGWSSSARCSPWWRCSTTSTSARWMFIVEEDGPALSTPTAILVAVLICAVVITVAAWCPTCSSPRPSDAVAGF